MRRSWVVLAVVLSLGLAAVVPAASASSGGRGGGDGPGAIAYTSQGDDYAITPDSPGGVGDGAAGREGDVDVFTSPGPMLADPSPFGFAYLIDNAASGNNGVTLRAGYTVYLVESAGIDRVEANIAASIADLNLTLGASRLVLASGRIANRAPAAGEILVLVGTAGAPCGGTWAGCADAHYSSAGAPWEMTGGRVYLDPGRLAGLSTWAIVGLLTHEIGHHLNLGHFSPDFNGRPQTMNPTIASSVQSQLGLGDINGLHYMNDRTTPVGVPPYWRGWDIVRGVAVLGRGSYGIPAGVTLDGWGGKHAYGGAVAPSGGPYWRGWDIARGIAVNSQGAGYICDAWGGVHAVGGAQPLAGGPYWRGWDIVRGVAVTPDARGAVLVDGWGGRHPVGDVSGIDGSGGPYWRGWDIVRGVALLPDGSGGYVLDGWGGKHPFGQAPNPTGGPYWRGWDIARGISIFPDGTGGVVIDAWGGTHEFTIT